MSAIQALTPGKERTRKYVYRVQPTHGSNKITMSVRPVNDIYLDGPPDHDELCSIVWNSKGRLVKFINRACPNHKWVKCIIEYVV